MTPCENNSLMETDRLTDLPEGVKEKILTYLPIKEAWRTCILSSKWRYTWQSIPELYLNDFTGFISNFVQLVDAIFVLHIGSIRKFTLYARRNSLKALGGWIVYLSRNGIRELTLRLNIYYTMHSRFFSCNELNYVNLTGCSFRVPLQFKGFKLLQTLIIRWATISDGDLERLISSCPLLEKLKLDGLFECTVMNIHAPNLLSLEIELHLSKFQICAPKLRSLLVDADFPDESFPHRGSVLCNLPELENIRCRGCFFTYLCYEHLREDFPLTFDRLKNLYINLDFGEQKEVAFALALFHRAPHLQSLKIDGFLGHHATAFPNAEIWEKIDRRGSLFKQLETVKIGYFIAEDFFLSFIKFILCSAPQLVALTIEEDEDPEYEEDVGPMFAQLLQFERASPNAKILFE